MIPTIHVEDSAQGDLEAAVRWYKNIRPGLQDEYRLCVRAALHRISRYPEAYPKVGKRLRRALIDRFPFAVFYLQDADLIRVFAVLHTHRSPRFWKQYD